MIKNRYYAHLKRIMVDFPKKKEKIEKMTLEEALNDLANHYRENGTN